MGVAKSHLLLIYYLQVLLEAANVMFIVDLQIEIDDAEKDDIVESSSPAQEIELDELLQDFEESEELWDDSYDLEESPPGSVETHDIIDDEVIENDDTSITLEITMK